MNVLRWRVGSELHELRPRLPGDRLEVQGNLRGRALTLVRSALGYQLSLAAVRSFLAEPGAHLQGYNDREVRERLLQGVIEGRYLMGRHVPPPTPQTMSPGESAVAEPYEPEPAREPREREPLPSFEVGALADPLPLVSVAAEPEGALELETSVGPTPDRDD